MKNLKRIVAMVLVGATVLTSAPASAEAKTKNLYPKDPYKVDIKNWTNPKYNKVLEEVTNPETGKPYTFGDWTTGNAFSLDADLLSSYAVTPLEIYHRSEKNGWVNENDFQGPNGECQRSMEAAARWAKEEYDRVRTNPDPWETEDDVEYAKNAYKRAKALWKMGVHDGVTYYKNAKVVKNPMYKATDDDDPASSLIKIKKTGHYVIENRASHKSDYNAIYDLSWMRFIAPKAGTYTFKFSCLSTVGWAYEFGCEFDGNRNGRFDEIELWRAGSAKMTLRATKSGKNAKKSCDPFKGTACTAKGLGVSKKGSYKGEIQFVNPFALEDLYKSSDKDVSHASLNPYFTIKLKKGEIVDFSVGSCWDGSDQVGGKNFWNMFRFHLDVSRK